MNPAKNSGEYRFASLKEGRNIFQITIKSINEVYKNMYVCVFVCV